MKRLVDLGVPLHLWDTNNQLGLAVKLDFDRDVAPIVRFLADVGIDPDDIGDVLGGNPGLFEEELEDLHTRVNYLTSKLFSRQQIVQLICGSPKWLSFPVALIDARLGFFQKTFGLIGQEVRDMAVRMNYHTNFEFPFATVGSILHVQKLKELISQQFLNESFL